VDGALLLPMSQLTARASELEPYKAQQIAVHCHHGGRSLRVAGWLREQGFAGAQSMAGGIDRWALEIEPGMTRY
ncbi:MAG TPA: rhodanese-like domain-containing protein, partial [Pirellulales bacterium]|nr:rhodanese-like domain-containing protein [Pirellulales bacterium]